MSDPATARGEERHGTAWSARRRVRLLTGLHFIDDAYQGAVPAILPVIAASGGLSYSAVAGLFLAATGLSSVLQPVMGFAVDRRGLPWLAPTGVAIAAIGFGLVAVAPDYAATAAALAVSGIGVAAFHPAAAADVRRSSGWGSSGLGVFAAGGTVGFAFGPIAALSVVATNDLRVVSLLAIPGVVASGVALIALRRWASPGRSAQAAAPAVDDWRSFAVLSAIVVLRSVVSAAVATFLVLFAQDERGSDPTAASLLLVAFLWASVVGTVAGGWLGDRIGRVRTAMLGFVLSAPLLVLLALVPSLLLPATLGLGIAVALPFAVLVALGQDYLPTRVGVASGITLGIAVSVGGLVTPFLGAIADDLGLADMLALLAVVPLVALVACVRLREPRSV